MKPILVIGSINQDIRIELDRLPIPGETVSAKRVTYQTGGKGANQAAAAALLGGNVSMIGCVGDDQWGRNLKHHLASNGVDTRAVREVPASPSGMALVMVDASAENMIAVAPGANSLLTENDISQLVGTVGEEGATIMAQLEVPRNIVMEALSRASEYPNVIRLLNPSPAEGVEPAMLEGLDLVVVNEVEAQQILDLPRPVTGTEEAAQVGLEFLRTGVKSVIITLGKRGAVLATADSLIACDAPVVDAVDTTGAGDQFMGALAFRLSSGADVQDAFCFAVQLASISTTRFGAQDSFVTKDELDTSTNAILPTLAPTALKPLSFPNAETQGGDQPSPRHHLSSSPTGQRLP
jgi:ribokinase